MPATIGVCHVQYANHNLKFGQWQGDSDLLGCLMFSGTSCNVVTPLLVPGNVSQIKRSVCATWRLCRSTATHDQL